MPVDVVMPQMGESIFEGTITKWLKKPGDKVERDEPLFEISTDKVDAEIPSPSAGVLKEIKVPEGQTVPIQTIVAVIDGAGSAAASAPAPAPAATAPAAKPAPAAPAAPTRACGQQARCTASRSRGCTLGPCDAPRHRQLSTERIHSSPLVRRMAKEHGVDLSTIEGSGAGGRITKQDIEVGDRGIVRQAVPKAHRHRLPGRLQQDPRFHRRLRLPWPSPARRQRMAASLFPHCRWESRASASISGITKCTP